MTVESRIIKVLKESKEPLSMSELVSKVRGEESSVRPVTIKAAVLPLISTDRVDLTSDLKLRARE